ncbi:sporulation related domain protein [Hydrogenophaga sp. RAC07]|uniref:SPOR domain-containing protein n=1 Tax=Hydrogenophaga sp. RAC07 TaxID=1842537 RepID=UPI000858BBB2|nr:SPOR domain-containing protein [Hydrogenophaga sp. RAC07]AOF87959.1 sporulation related domain protein [Hydrogenophaga sp. RAC07]
MPAPSQPAATAPESATIALYRAALGTVNVGRYLPVFERFDEEGRAGPSWNWAAALLTLNWLVFRQLWGVALVYVAAVEGLALLVLGLGREWLAKPSLAEWGFLGAILVLSCLIPGVYGNAWLHADTRRSMTRAVRDAKTVREACGALAQRASNRKRLLSLVLINAVLAVAAAGAYWGLSRWVDDRPVLPTEALPETVAPAEPPPVQPVPPTPVQPVEPPPTPSPSEPVAEPPPVPPAEPVAPQPTATLTPAPVAAQVPAQRPTAPASRADPLQSFAINVGLFADAGNADRVLTRLVDAGLPAFIQVVDSPNGQRTRVRVGPFGSRALADDAAARIRALGLDAVVFRQ